MVSNLKRVPVSARVAAAVIVGIALVWLFVRRLAGPHAAFVDVAMGASAVGTCAAAVVVAWQAIMTLEAVRAAKTAADLSRELIAEAVKTRLDSRAPSTSLVMQDPAMWPPYEPSDFGEAQPISLNRQYRLPKDAQELIEVRALVQFTNHSDKSLQVTLSDVVPATWDQQRPPPTTIRVSRGRQEQLFVIQRRSVQQWIEVAESQRAQKFIDTVGHVYFSDEYDDGIADRWSAVLAGSPLRPVEGLGSTWEVLPTPNDDPSGFEVVNCVITGMERTYFLSKRRNLPLSTLTEAGGTTS